MRAWALSCIGLVGCASDPSPVLQRAPLESGEAARVGRSTIELAAVQQLVSERSLDARTALRALVREALLAERLREDSPALASYLERVTLARRLSESFLQEARAAGPATDAEVDEFTQRHWWELDRPESARVTHAVVVCQKCSDPEGARALAERIREAVHGVTESERFVEAARAVDPQGFSVKVETLSPVAADGRVVQLQARPDPNFSFGSYHVEFAKAANAIEELGHQSAVVQSPSGFHVMLLTERLPEQRSSLEERRESLTEEILAARGKRVQDEVLARVRAGESTEIMRSFDEMTERVLVDSVDP